MSATENTPPDPNAEELPILGDLCEFNGRFVFLGRHPEHDGIWFVAFQREDGRQTKIILSHEALDTLVRMHANFQPRTMVCCPPR